MGTHYSCHQSKRRLEIAAKFLASKLKELPKDRDLYLVYSGMSGVSLATAIMLYSRVPLGMIYVRKQGEVSHSCYGKEVDTSDLCSLPTKPFLIFVDDFISTGSTFKWCKKVIDADSFFPNTMTCALLSNDCGVPNFEELGIHQVFISTEH